MTAYPPVGKCIRTSPIYDENYARAREAVRELGLDPDSVEHHRP